MNKFEVLNFYHLLDKSFSVPFYQRGYRWEKQQVEDMLNDFLEFVNKKKKPGEFYCLQPVVVKQHDGVYDLIDGQQRLTTIYLIMTYLEGVRHDNCDKNGLYSLHFERVEKGNDYLANTTFVEDLKKFKEGNTQDCKYPQNIDSFFIFQAYKCIDEWFANKKSYKIKIAQTITGEISQDDDNNKNDIRVLWYLLDSGDEISSIDAFTRLNEGKIPLTEAELVKALLFQCDCYTENQALMKEQAFRRSCEWDEMEKKLQSPNFWDMIAPADYSPSSHLQLVIEFVSRSLKANNPAKYNFSEEKEWFSFLVINKFVNDKLQNVDDKNKDKAMSEAIGEIWKLIQDTFTVFNNWYLDRHTYHLVGLLTILNGHTWKKQLNMLKEIYDIFSMYDKDEAKNILRRKIGNYIHINKKIGENSLFYNPKNTTTNFSLSTINYLDCPELVTRVLEAFNIYLHITDESSGSMFQFAKFREFKVTSLEHIHPQHLDTDNMAFSEVKSWFEARRDKLHMNKTNVKAAADRMNEILVDIDSKKDNEKDDAFKSYQEEIVELEKTIDEDFDELAGMKPEYMHTLYNMALVDKDTNSALSNNILFVKRTILHKREANQETYVPVGTYAAFDKRFSSDIIDMKFWSPNDRNAYFSQIEKAYNYFTND